ncbi:MAG: hypothetical protein EPO01_15195 [Aquabacterium sp.]|nr:MAG: hypothetical protein EPO01_15195 [Aquabacterium sp.]
MKWLLWILLLGGAIWLLRGARVRTPAQARPGGNGDHAQPAQQAKKGSREIVPCSLCGVHLPRDEAVVGPDGRSLFCSEAHRIELQARQRRGGADT